MYIAVPISGDFLQQEHLEKRLLLYSKETILSSLIPAMSTGIITTTESGVDVVFEWKIENFFNLLERNGAGYLSPNFSFGGKRWWLRIYPNGWSRNDFSGYLDLYLCVSSDDSIRQSFSLSLKIAEGEKYNEQHFSKDFDNGNWFHEFNRFIPISELSRRRSDLAPEGDLTVICTMKSSTSGGSDSNTACSSASSECRHCKGNFNADSLSSHQKKCKHRPTKCPDCLEVVVLENWLNEHECQQERQEAGKKHKENSENTGLNASTQTEEKNSEACASGPFTSHHEKKVLHDFKELFLQKEDCDVIIKVKGLEFPAHRLVLKARSPVFASTFRHNMKESATNIVEIKDCDPSSFLDFLCFLYCGDIGMICRENVISLFTAADKYEVLDLKAECLEFLKKNITVDTFCETITLALQHSEPELIALATEFFVGNAEEILLTVKWQTFAAENPTQSNGLVIKFVRSVKH